MKMLYMDHAASAPPYEEVVAVMSEVMRTFYANPSSYHGAGAAAEKLVKQAAEVLAERLKAEPEELIFTSGGTESNNMAIFGAAKAFANRGKHCITTRIEHASVYECFRELERQGCEVTYLDADASGAVNPEDVARALRDDTILVSVMAVNNETGRIQPIERIGALLSQRPRTLFHVDAVQAAGRLTLDPRQAGIDLLSLSAHKFRGPKGIGALYKRKGLSIMPLHYGGGQQNGYRSGTENVPSIVGMAKALRIATDRMEQDRAKLAQLRRILLDRLAQDPRIRQTGSEDDAEMAPHIVHVRIPGLRAEVMVHALEREGFYISSQSACSSGEEKPSRVLLAMGCSEEEAKSGLRISLSSEHEAGQVERLATAILQCTNHYRQMMG